MWPCLEENSIHESKHIHKVRQYTILQREGTGELKFIYYILIEGYLLPLMLPFISTSEPSQLYQSLLMADFPIPQPLRALGWTCSSIAAPFLHLGRAELGTQFPKNCVLVLCAARTPICLMPSFFRAWQRTLSDFVCTYVYIDTHTHIYIVAILIVNKFLKIPLMLLLDWTQEFCSLLAVN